LFPSTRRAGFNLGEDVATFERPTNTFAEQVVRLRSENSDLDVQLQVLTTKRTDNLSMISDLGELATWETVEEPDPEPVDPPSAEDL
jgi:hypothetical protein